MDAITDSTRAGSTGFLRRIATWATGALAVHAGLEDPTTRADDTAAIVKPLGYDDYRHWPVVPYKATGDTVKPSRPIGQFSRRLDLLTEWPGCEPVDIVWYTNGAELGAADIDVAEGAIASLARRYCATMTIPRPLQIRIDGADRWASYNLYTKSIHMQRNFTDAHGDGKPKTWAASIAILAHEYGHGLFEENIERALEPYNVTLEEARDRGLYIAEHEFFADAVAAEFYRDSATIRRALLFRDSENGDVCAANGREYETRDFKSAIEPDGWHYIEPHIELAPARSFTGWQQPYRIESPDGVRSLMGPIAKALAKDVIESIRQNKWPKSEDRNRRLIDALRKSGPTTERTCDA